MIRGPRDPLWWLALVFILFIIAIAIQGIRNGISGLNP